MSATARPTPSTLTPTRRGSASRFLRPSGTSRPTAVPRRWAARRRTGRPGERGRPGEESRHAALTEVLRVAEDVLRVIPGIDADPHGADGVPHPRVRLPTLQGVPMGGSPPVPVPVDLLDETSVPEALEHPPDRRAIES